MAIIDPVPVITDPIPGVEVVLWETLTEADTAASLLAGGTRPVVSSVQMVGTWGGGVIALQGSNDGTNFVTIKDSSDTAISFSANDAVDFSTSFRYIKPVATTAGTGRDVDIYLVMRG